MQLGARQGDGTALRVHLQRAAASGAIDPRLQQSQKPLPPSVAALWDALLELRSASAGPVSHQGIQAWQQLHQVRLSPWEVETILCCDRVARDVEATPTRKDLST